ncbi:PoNi-like cognate immunity protein [Cupriavidus basilensis]|uniref:PoNi-like cognate immunity protein n=1 Tax=Cupriavidus basilensis TaxID=68895 RepID=UPI0020A673BD|nr:PoNi-like cognate immunity protein [Cupriavidus basilensis]MCP3025194.1 PoNi-like cognate immunity protein [Cupriavidus basilensis]
MRRDVLGSSEFWNEWVDFEYDSIAHRKKIDAMPGGDANYRPQYLFELVKSYFQLILRRYSRGDSKSDLVQHFGGLLDTWEESEKLGRNVWTAEQARTRHAWTVNLDHYIVCFWLTGLALTLNIPDEQWQRLVALMGNEGEDALLDRVIASRQSDRKIGTTLCFPKVYQRLLDAVDALPEQQPKALRVFLDHWFVSLKNAGHPSFPPSHRTPYWYTFGQINPEGGAYFGYWCVEAVAVAKAFGIDDSLCLDHPNYPGDLLMDGRSPRYPDEVAAEQPSAPARGWLRRLLGK